MGTFLGFLLFIGICVAFWLVQTGIGKSVSAVDRSVRAGTYAAGRAEAHATLSITAPISPADLTARVVTAVNAHPSSPAVVSGLYLKARTHRLAQFGFGSAARGDIFDAVLRLTPTTTGCSGTYEILHWQESGADVLGRREMVRLRNRIEGVVRATRGSMPG